MFVTQYLWRILKIDNFHSRLNVASRHSSHQIAFFMSFIIVSFSSSIALSKFRYSQRPSTLNWSSFQRWSSWFWPDFGLCKNKTQLRVGIRFYFVWYFNITYMLACLNCQWEHMTGYYWIINFSFMKHHSHARTSIFCRTLFRIVNFLFKLNL